MKMLLIDNFDSFVYNIFQYLAELGAEVDVIRNDVISLEEIKSRNYDKIVISPGPGNPGNKKDFGVSREVIQKLGDKVPILGICLGHQGIIQSFGGKIVKTKPMHGKLSRIKHNQKGLFFGIKNPMMGMRYHSLIGEEETLPTCFDVIAKSEEDGAIMAIQHKSLPIFGIQFHPESIFTEQGKEILRNFVNY